MPILIIPPKKVSVTKLFTSLAKSPLSMVYQRKYLTCYFIIRS